MENVENSHSQLYKLKGADAQEKRRELFLQEQERKREELLDRHRVTLWALENGNDKPKNLRRNPRSQMAEMLMLSEWLIRPPEDLETAWMFVMCPEGRRCIVSAQNGKTVAVSKKGKQIITWVSALPGGGPRSPSTITILDCVYSDLTRTFYVLDVLHWGDLPLIGTEMSFRQFWIQSRLKDEFSSRFTRKYNFIPLESLPCSRDQLETSLAQYPYFPENKPKLDGILFYHIEGLYIQGSTPLVGWIKPFMVPEVLGMTIPSDYYSDRPVNYENYIVYMTDFDESRKKKRRTKNIDIDIDVDLSDENEIVDGQMRSPDTITDILGDDDEQTDGLTAVDFED